MNEPLKPCPFCNTTPILQHTPETGYYIHCPTCQSYTHGIEWSRAEALAVWNNRADVVDPALHALAAQYNMTWSEFCQALAADKFWPIEPK